MQDKTSLFFVKLADRTGKWYPILTLQIMFTINTPLLILVTAIPAQQNAEFTRAEGISLLLFGILLLIIRNSMLIFQFLYFNKDLFLCLSNHNSNHPENSNPTMELRAWEQATAASKNLIFYEFVELFTLILFPLIAFGYFGLHLRLIQIIYLCSAVVASGLINLIFQNFGLDQWFEPIIHKLLPVQYEFQLENMNGMHLWVKLSLIIIGLFLASFLIFVPAAYHQVQQFASNGSINNQIVTTAMRTILLSSFSILFLGIFISTRMIFYFSNPFKKLIRSFKEIENGDLNQRIAVTSADEFGFVNIHFNHMIARIQTLTNSLEQQVAERTLKLSLSNEKLQIELAERKRIEEKLSYTALHDALSDLPNRTLFMDRLQHAIEHSKRHKNFTYAVFFLDLDRFKVVNDSLGHNIGDLLLIESARCLLDCVRREDTVARLGGDEFVILIEDLESTADYIAIADRIQRDLAVPTNLNGHKVFISVSIGIVLKTDHYEHPEEVLRDADIAMYRAKREGRGCYKLFDPSMLDGAISRLELESDLRNALDHNEFIINYQPIMDMRAPRIIGFEALVRWQHPRRGLLSPAEFITAAEDLGLIVPLGYWVLDEASRQIRAWQLQYPANPPLSINVNLSTRQFIQGDLVEKIAEILKKNDLAPSSLNLELTESILIEDSTTTSIILNKLRNFGVQVQIDDFGTGYSSLGYLNTLPIDTLKIDRSFINRIGNNGNGSEIIQMILALAHSLGMKVVAEGVETYDQLSILLGMNCEYMQGFLFAKPVNHLEAADLLEKSSMR